MVIAIIDTGVAFHEELSSCILSGKNFTDEGNSQNVNDNNGHGTHIAGIIHKNTEDAKLLVIKVLNRHGNGTAKSIAEGIYFAIENKVDIINISIGINYDDKVLHEAVKEASNNNILVIAASGNSQEIEYPACYDEVISVGSLDENNNISKYSSSECDEYFLGEDIYSTYLNNSYEKLSGTSMSCAFITAKYANS